MALQEPACKTGPRLSLDEAALATVAATLLSGFGLVLKDHQRRGLRSRMRDGERAVSHTHRLGDLCRAAMQQQQRPARRLAANLDLAPGHAEADACPQCLRRGLLGRKPRGKALRRITALALAVGDLSSGVDALQEAASIPLDGVSNPLDLHHVDAG